MQHRKVITRRGKTVIAIAGVAVGVLALLGVIEYVLSGSDSSARPNVTATTTTQNEFQTPDPVQETTEPSAEVKVATGSFKQQRGMLTVEVTRVEATTTGRVKLFVTATNASQARMTLPVDGIAVLDDLQRTYAASSSKWEPAITRGSTTSGTVVLDEKVSPDVKSLTLTFNSISGQFAPTGAAITVTDIPLPK
ncbi:hypothetical protein SAMN05216553_106507 [Lentzea fradiae]|uniref:DUF4352 domain-containing protein n=1 Tax=Lentzea fradiae TaxID=200378 RepID=A0A1G7SXK1_9PSEU|nr:hypothetical protein [Lentzea fradiae]SDG27159.1 hypothetical protein SAMN05216553_106507 [Lentzea fradiae]